MNFFGARREGGEEEEANFGAGTRAGYRNFVKKMAIARTGRDADSARREECKYKVHDRRTNAMVGRRRVF